MSPVPKVSEPRHGFTRHANVLCRTFYSNRMKGMILFSMVLLFGGVLVAFGGVVEAATFFRLQGYTWRFLSKFYSHAPDSPMYLVVVVLSYVLGAIVLLRGTFGFFLVCKTAQGPVAPFYDMSKGPTNHQRFSSAASGSQGSFLTDQPELAEIYRVSCVSKCLQMGHTVILSHE